MVSSGQKHCLHAADIRVQLRGDLLLHIEYLRAVNDNLLPAVRKSPVGGVLSPVGRIETGLRIHVQRNRKAFVILDKILSLDLNPDIAVDILAEIHVCHL